MGKSLREIFKTIIISIIVTLFITTFIAQITQIKGRSMEPSLVNGERIINVKFVYKIEEPKRGEVVIFKPPFPTKETYIKRIIGLPGEKVEIREGYVYINDKLLKEPYITNRSHDNWGPKIIPPDMYFVLGDNRVNSSDSRVWGFLPKKNIIGKAILIFWPLNKLKYNI